MLDNKEMRAVYVEELCKIAEKDNRIVLVEADLAKASATYPFRDKFPERFINVGIAEANMIGVAAGLANYGKIPFTHTFTPFATRRVLDQIAISVAYSNLNVKMMGSDPGIAAQLNGGTHMSFEDIALMRVIPGMVIFEPVDSTQLKKALPQIIEHDGPVYIRLYRQAAEKIYDEDCEFTLGKANLLREGKDATVFASGIMVKEALDAANTLQGEGISVKVINIHTIKPLDEAAVVEAAKETGAVVTAENHNIVGGLGGAICELLSEKCPVPVKRIGVTDHFGEVGKLAYLAEKYNLTASDIVKAVKSVIERKK